jgi:hypothetical protein
MSRKTGVVLKYGHGENTDENEELTIPAWMERRR